MSSITYQVIFYMNSDVAGKGLLLIFDLATSSYYDTLKLKTSIIEQQDAPIYFG